ncbi:MAG TPA: PKD domain-containing protein [Puia sp.]|nr:PKD domain-containing protein [Puia sp.]
MKLNKLGRAGLFVTWFTLTALHLSAQSGGYSYLEFVENKGQWDHSVPFQARMPTGSIFMQHKGFTVLLEDTSDLLRIGELLHGDFERARVPSPTYPSHPGGGWAIGGNPSAGSAKGAVAANSISPAATTVPISRQILPPGQGGGARGASNDPFLLHLHSYRVSFVGANDSVRVMPDKAVAGYNNYFIGDRKNWAARCRIYQGLLYKDMYPGIDIHYHTDVGTLKYDIVVHPGADPNQVVLQYEGQTKLSVRKNRVYIQTSVGTVQELEPHSYQVNASGRSEVQCKYTLLPGNRIRFSVAGYSPDATLVIDPTESFCSFTGSRSDNWGYTATYDGSGNLYLGGIVLDESDISGTNGSGYLVSPGAFQTTFQGGDGSEGGPSGGGYQYDVGIMKLNTSGANRIFATYLGGSGDEQPHSMIVDNNGDLIVTGRTSSPNFPLNSKGANPTLYGPGGGFDIFVTKFTPDGTGLIGSRRIGGTANDGVNYEPKYVVEGAHDLRLNYGDDGRSEVILDGAGNIYLAACTQSTDFPVTPGVFQPAPVNGGGGQDGVLLKLSPDLNNVLFSSYIGGENLDVATVLALSPADNTIWVAGGTLSTQFPGTGNAPVVQASSAGGIDGFIAQVSNDGSTLIRASYYGSNLTDMIYGIDFDKKGYPYVMGTTSGLIPAVNSPFNAGGNQASGKQFITKFQRDLSGIVYSANFGPAGQPYPSISPTAFLVDRCENVYVSGWGGGPNIYERYTGNDGSNGVGTNGLTATGDALRGTTDNNDFYFFVLQKNAASQLYGSFFGQVGGVYGDHVDGGTSRYDAQGVIYEAICANCYGGAQFPTTIGVFAPTNGTSNGRQTTGCNEAGVKIAFNFAGVAAGLKTVTHGRGDSVGCIPLSVSLSDTIRNAKSYIWNFGDGSGNIPTTNYQMNHTYNITGTFLVTLIAIDSNSCNVADTAYREIVVKNNPATLNFDFTKIPPCTSLSYVFTNLSTSPPGLPFGDSSFLWNFGDGTSPAPDGPTPITHSFASPGAYNVTLSLIDTNYCNYPLDTTRLVNVAQNVKAQFVTPAIGCAPDSAMFNNTSIGGETYYWNFGDGSGIDSTDISPVHYYPDPGPYTITLIAVNPNTCNVRDTTSTTITLYTKPAADFTYQPLPSQVNTPTVFAPTSSPAVQFLWLFGDGTSEVKTAPDTVVHQYVRTDTFNVCLLVTNAEGCTDTVCHPVAALINPLLDVPNAFTPGRFGTNAIVKVVGFGIVHMTWRIYNRWGQAVFQSDDPNIGWDGYYRGVLQPMDVYAYTLEVEFSDGTHATKKGDITLIR